MTKRVQYPIYKGCLHCKQKFPCYKKRQVESRKYCSTKCMYASPDYKRNLIVGAKAASWKSCAWMKNPELQRRATEAARATRIKRYGAWEDRKVKLTSGDILDVTNKQVADYRLQHEVCEICGKPEKISTGKTAEANKLCIDHCHKSLRFRGLLCCDCNRKLGWYENVKDGVHAYLSRFELSNQSS